MTTPKENEQKTSEEFWSHNDWGTRTFSIPDFMEGFVLKEVRHMSDDEMNHMNREFKYTFKARPIVFLFGAHHIFASPDEDGTMCLVNSKNGSLTELKPMPTSGGER